MWSYTDGNDRVDSLVRYQPFILLLRINNIHFAFKTSMVFLVERYTYAYASECWVF